MGGGAGATVPGGTDGTGFLCAALLTEAATADARVRREAGPASSGLLATLGCAAGAGIFPAQPVVDGDRGVPSISRE